MQPIGPAPMMVILYFGGDGLDMTRAGRCGSLGRRVSKGSW